MFGRVIEIERSLIDAAYSVGRDATAEVNSTVDQVHGAAHSATIDVERGWWTWIARITCPRNARLEPRNVVSLAHPLKFHAVEYTQNK